MLRGILRWITLYFGTVPCCLSLTLKTHCNRACAAFEQLLLPGIVFCTIVHLLPYFVDVARLGSDEISCVSACVCVCVCVCSAGAGKTVSELQMPTCYKR